MRIVFIGQAAFGGKVLQALLQTGEKVAGIYVPVDTPGRPDPLKEATKRLGVSAFQLGRTWGVDDLIPVNSAS